MGRSTTFIARAALVSALLPIAGCVSSQGGSPGDGAVAVTASPKRYEVDPVDKPKQVCESTTIGGEPKNVCY